MADHESSPNDLFRTLVCRLCGTARLPDVALCPSCRAAPADERIAGRVARLISFTTIHRVPVEDLGWEAPYSLGLVETDAGARLLALLDWQPDDSDIDEPVTLGVRESRAGRIITASWPGR